MIICRYLKCIQTPAQVIDWSVNERFTKLGISFVVEDYQYFEKQSQIFFKGLRYFGTKHTNLLLNSLANPILIFEGADDILFL